MKLFLCLAAIGLTVGCQPTLQRLSGASPTSQNIAHSSDAQSGPVMRIDISSRNASARLSRVAVNKDVETWLAVDNISLSFRQGVLVASRGLGFDLMGADVQGTLNAISGQGEDVYRHQMRYLTGDNHTNYLMAGCSMKLIGVDVVNAQQLQRFDETCKARRNNFTNIFWLNGLGDIVQSRQWVSPEIGFIMTRFEQELSNN